MNSHMMKFLRELFWLSALFNFHLTAYHITGSVNVEGNHVSGLHESDHFLAYCYILEKLSIDIFILPACNCMSARTFQFLRGKYLQPPMFCLYLLYHLLLVFKKMSFVIASTHMLLMPSKVTAVNILPIVYFVN